MTAELPAPDASPGAPDPSPGAPDPLAGAQAWRRLHPATPFVRGWAALVVGLGIFVNGFIGGSGPDLRQKLQVDAQLGIILLIAVVAILANVALWFNTFYRIEGEAVQLRSGLISRSMRQARLDRVQAVDVVQPLVGRLVGLSELRIEVAGGAGSDVRLAYLRDSEAHRLRNALLAAAAGVTYDTDEAPEAPETPVLQVPVGRLLASIVLSVGGVVSLLMMLGIVVTVAVTGSLAALAGALPVVLGGAGYLFRQFTQGFNFRLATSPDGVRVRAGLTETRAATIPPGRVQAVSFSQSLVWRRWGWWRVRVNIAGYGPGEDANGRTLLLPVGTTTDALWVLRLVVPDIGTDDPVPLLAAAMRGSGTERGFVVSPRAARWLDPLSFRRNGYAVTTTTLLARSGVLTRSLVIVPHQRVQSIGMAQGPVQRALGVATVGLHSTPGPISPAVRHMSTEEALRLVDEQATRSRNARAGDRSHRWMEHLAAEQAGRLSSEDSPPPE